MSHRISLISLSLLLLASPPAHAAPAERSAAWLPNLGSLWPFGAMSTASAPLALPAPPRNARIVAQAPNMGVPIRFFPHGEDSLAARLAAIKGAQHTIDILTYIFEPCDSSTKVLLDAILDRANAGVAVRLLVDNSEISSPSGTQKPSQLATYLAQHLSGPNAKPIDFRLYQHPSYGFLPNFEGADNRSHIKLTVIDSAGENPLAFVGGRNNSDGYFGLSDKMNYFDMDVLLSGAAVAKVEAGLARVVQYAVFSTPAVSVGDNSAFEGSCMKRSDRDQAVASGIGAKAATIFADVAPLTCPNIYFDADDPRYRMNSLSNSVGEDDLQDDRLSYKDSSMLVLNFLDEVESNLEIANQYYIPVAKLDLALKKLRDGGKMVTVYTNETGDAGPRLNARMNALTANAIQTDSVKGETVMGITSAGGLRDMGSLSVPGAPWRIHTKTAVRDSRDVLISSFNLDSRSYQINAEDALMVENCPALAAAVHAEYQKLQEIYNSDKDCAECQAITQKSKALLPLNVSRGKLLVDFLF